MIPPSALIKTPDTIKIDPTATIGDFVILSGTITIGPYTIIQSHTILDGSITIGRNSYISAYSNISSRNSTPIIIGEYVIFKPYTNIQVGSRVPDYYGTTIVPQTPLTPNIPTAVSTFHNYRSLLEDRKGLEIGGPSPYLMPTGIYTFPAHLDNLVYSSDTLWAKTQANKPYLPDKPGTTIINDVVNMSDVPTASYDFVVASHMLEHTVNPLKAINEITRILRPNGICILVLPWKEGTFDHRRPISQFSKLISNYTLNRAENNVEDYLDEVREFYDISRDSGVKSMDDLIERCRHHEQNRALHVHVFDFALIIKCLQLFNYQIVDCVLVEPYHQIVVGRRIG